jgi:hypothetical protein
MHEPGHTTLAILVARQLCERPRALSIAAPVTANGVAVFPQPSQPGRFSLSPPARRASSYRDNLRPDRNHAHEQGQRGQRSGFFDDGTNHDTHSRR